MKKLFKKRLKNWKIGDYIRQFSIVTGGVLLTLWLTGYISDASKQREVRQAMQLVTLELQNNLETIQHYNHLFFDEKRMALCLQEQEFSTTNLPADTIMRYHQRLYGGRVKPFRFSTDALEMLKTSGLTAHIADKQLVIDLLHCYNSIKAFDNSMDFYFDMRKEVMTSYDKKNPQKKMPTQDEDYIAVFGQMTADPNIQNWLCTLPRAFDTHFFEKYEMVTEATISQLETAYK